jgi:hypothetical protein
MIKKIIIISLILTFLSLNIYYNNHFHKITNNRPLKIMNDMEGINVHVYYENKIYKNIINKNHQLTFENDLKNFLSCDRFVKKIDNYNENQINIYIENGTQRSYRIPWPPLIKNKIIILSKNNKFTIQKK